MVGSQSPSLDKRRIHKPRISLASRLYSNVLTLPISLLQEVEICHGCNNGYYGNAQCQVCINFLKNTPSAKPPTKPIFLNLPLGLASSKDAFLSGTAIAGYFFFF